jgi:PAS domain S-box-containing protein
MSDPDRHLTASPQEVLSASIPQRQQFHARLLDQVQEAVIAADLSGRVIYWNRFAEHLYGWKAEEALGRNILELTPSDDSRLHAEIVMDELRSGRTWTGEIVLKRRNGTTFPAHVSDGPLNDEKGNLIGIVGISYDITPRRQAEERQALLIRELHHRVKNTLSTVQAIMTTTARTAVTMEEFQAAFFGRVDALARTHALLTEDQLQSVGFLDLLQAELQPYDDGTRSRIVLQGAPVQLPSQLAVPVGMAIHELTTNAVKHGALSASNGSLVVRWREVNDSGRKLCWDWNEHDGPPVELPTREGFGTRLLQRLLTAQTGADVKIEFEPDGIHVFVAIPLA